MSCGIYKFENKINHMVYIGQAIDLEERYKKHCKNIKDTSHQEDFYQGLREFGLTNFSYEVLESFEEYDLEKLNQLEIKYIKKYNSLKPNGYNMVSGGTNGAGLAKGKKVQQFDLKGNFIAEYQSAHQAEKIVNINYSSICACCRGEIIHTKNYQWKYSDDKNKIITDISLLNCIIKTRPVLQYSLDKKLLNEYPSLTEASVQSGVSKSLICNVCKGKGKTAGNFIWRYKDTPLNEKTIIHSKNRLVGQYDKNNNLLQIYNSLTEAGKSTNTNIANIQSVCAGKRKTANNYIWKYLE